ncbi:sigma 54-interacting transcriptional regulator [Thiocapsa roseopersicina]|uniref:Sigma-54 interaction domain-containing protein n=1 Tax=Thiocapsa roseopersicina TaxID=1058 RepID=A0A1H2W3M1_THIRO|nr:sigma-54 dependent transcriptional regulator [Thiocapsa roseopersicina]SDW75086.1 Sigma-54 interaction domain-containing protein [Thiocapsa roseopersicina]
MDDFAQLNLVGRSPAFLAALAAVAKFAVCDATVLIEGETGTGKELVARAVHYLSARRDAAFIPINCATLPDNLVESELFGHVRGAFTDAKEARIGLIAQAEGGTLFLDEIEAISPRAQAGLLRFLQNREYRPVGGTLVRQAKVRVLASSNADLKAMVAQGLFRSDLLFRLNVLSVQLPALRVRTGDIALLTAAFLRRLSSEFDAPVKTLSRASMGRLEAHSWPGNVRELENLVYREWLLATGSVIEIGSIEDSPADVDPPTATRDSGQQTYKVAKASAVAEFERIYMSRLLATTAGNMTLAAQIAGKDRSDLGKLLKKHGLSRQSFLGCTENP